MFYRYSKKTNQLFSKVKFYVNAQILFVLVCHLCSGYMFGTYKIVSTANIFFRGNEELCV